MADSRLGARRMQDELEYIGVPEDRKVLKKTDWESGSSESGQNSQWAPGMTPHTRHIT